MIFNFMLITDVLFFANEVKVIDSRGGSGFPVRYIVTGECWFPHVSVICSLIKSSVVTVCAYIKLVSGFKMV